MAENEGPNYTGHVRLESLYCRRAEFDQVVASPPGGLGGQRVSGDKVGLRVALRSRDRDGDRADVELRVKVEPSRENEQPYAVDVAYVGQFQFDDLPGSLTRQEFVSRNAAAILFPHVREAIGNLTSRGAFGPLWLPPINVVGMLEQEEGVEEETAPEQPQES